MRKYTSMKDDQGEAQAYGRVVYNLEAIAEKRGLTLNQIADSCNINRAVIRDAAQGIKAPSLKQLARVCFVLGCTPGDLLVYAPPTLKTAPQGEPDGSAPA